MREAKARLYLRIEREMRPVQFVDLINNRAMPTESDTWYHYSDESTDEALLWFTELPDKNGAEICDGDVLAFPQNNIKAFVFWDYEEGGWRIRFIARPTWSTDDLAEHHDRVEVIGNIHQHPELIA